MLKAVYKKDCPNCLRDISSIRLREGLFCESCDPDGLKCDSPFLEKFDYICKASIRLDNFNKFFLKKSGYELTSLQKTWAKRFFLGNSFALLAPTGIGKTTFGLMLSAFVKNSYIIFPTKALVHQALERFKEWKIDVLAYTGKKEEKEKIKKGEYDILITTNQFLYRNREIINKKFDLIFVDDVDSIVKSGKKVDILLSLLGFDENDIQEAFKAAKEKDYEKLTRLSKKRSGNLIVSSATANPRSKKIALFRYLLGFEITKPNLTLRNVEDVYDEEYSRQRALFWLKKFGYGGVVYLPGNKTKKDLEDFLGFLNENGIKAYSYEEFEKYEKDFIEQKALFVAFASYRNPLARGIDLPESLKYTFFYGVPKMEFQLRSDNYIALYFTLLNIIPYFTKNKILDYKELIDLENKLEFLKKYAFSKIIHPQVEEKLKEISSFFTEFVKKYEKEIKNSPDIMFDGEKIIIPDITGYIQASGRSSRFFRGHLTKGLAFMLIDSQKAFHSLRKKLRWYTHRDFKRYDEVDLDEIFREIESSRKNDEKQKLNTTLIIVESPTKAKTIASFYGKPSRRIVDNMIFYEILIDKGLLVLAASTGHDFDLCYDYGKWGVLEKYIPVFEIIQNKDNIIKAVQKTSYEVDEVYVATDPDREGEKISFDLDLNIRPFNLFVKRITFHEITKNAFENALKNPSAVNEDLVASQFVRRIADRWIGFGISEYLRKKLNNKYVSTGRVQTPVLEWICENTQSLSEKIYVVRILIKDLEIDFKFETQQEAKKFFINLPDKIEVILKETKEESLYLTPFTTSALLKEAALKLKFSPQKTMQLAQELFESGFITYHRTDSFKVSPVGIEIAKEYIYENFSEEYFKPRSFESSEGAHECIRPTSSMDVEDLKAFIFSKNIYMTSAHFKLYDLIFRRFIATQMIESVVVKSLFEILGKDVEIITSIKKHGYDLIYPVKVYEISPGVYLYDKSIIKTSKNRPYSYADIIEMMKNRGIGRPSTYAITIEKLLSKRFIKDRGGYLFATRLGFLILEESKKSPYAEFVEEKFTANLEEIMDEIEKGEKDYKEILIWIFSLLF